MQQYLWELSWLALPLLLQVDCGLTQRIGLIVTAVILMTTWQLLQESLNLILDAVPSGIEPLAVRTYLAERSGVSGVHDLHIWAMSTTQTALTAHLVMPAGHPDNAFLVQVSRELHDRFGIEHVTLQIELSDSANACAQQSDRLV